MAKTVFTPGTIVSSDFLNAINNPVFDGQAIDGHRAKVSDAELSDTGIKSKVDEQLRAFTVSIGAGDDVDITGGTFLSVDNVFTSLASSSLTISGNGTHYIFIDRNGSFGFSGAIPSVGLLLAKLVVSGASRTLTDLRSVNVLRPQANTIKIFGGHGEELSFRALASGVDGWVGNEYHAVNPTLTGQYNFSNFTVNAGATVTITNGAILNCTGIFTVAATGTIVVQDMASGGGSFTGTITGQTDVWSNSGAGIGGASGHNNTAAKTYTAYTSKIGSGGASAYFKSRINTAPTATNLAEVISIVSGEGGNGGGYLEVNSVGGIFIDGTILANGTEATNNVYNSGLVSGQFFLAGGAGGGSGGTVWLRSLQSVLLANGSIIEAKGGNGGNGLVSSNVSATYTARGGGGGGGGRVIIESPSNNTAGSTVTVIGGNPGTNGGYGGSTLQGSSGGSYGGQGGISATAGSAGVFEALTKIPG